MTEAAILFGFVAWSALAWWLGYRSCLLEWNAQDPVTQYQGRRASEVRELLRQGWMKSSALGIPLLFPPAPPMPSVRSARDVAPLLFGSLANGAK